MAYLPLSTANLPDPVIDPAQGASPEDYFGIDIYTGNGGTIDSDFGFDCDLVWYKNRSRANTYHYLFDQVRGDDLPLYSNDTFSEDSQFPTYHTQSFITGGSRIVRTIGDHLNFSGDSYVAWSWKANGSGVTNTDGSITSTVSANTTSGFSIVKYGGTGSAATVGHGLDQAPEMVIVKSMEGAFSWSVFHTSLGGTKNIFLNLTNAASTDSSHWNNTDPTSTVFSVGTNNGTNDSRYDHIAYCFHSVEGYSKFGSYTGNGSTDGAFVYTGFRPAFILGKNTTLSGPEWFIFDTTRDPYNVMDGYLYASTAGTEASGTGRIDLLSNGFKLRDSANAWNGSHTYIYMAFAEDGGAFKYSRAR